MKILPALAVVAGFLSLVSPAYADDAAVTCRGYVEDIRVKDCIEADTCRGDKSGCGSIIYVNNGIFQAHPVELTAMSAQPSDKAAINPDCEGYRQVRRGKLNGGEALEYIVPADCAYRLKIEIVAGNQKSRNLFLTPGCSIKARTSGTSQNNSWDLTISGRDTDGEGNKCGALNKM